MKEHLIIWKLKKWLSDLFEKVSHKNTRFTIKHTNKDNRVYVCIYDHEERKFIERRFGSYYYDDQPSWWKKGTMHDASYIYVSQPLNSEVIDGITFEDKISDAYAKLQIIVDEMNNKIQKQRELALKTAEASKAAAKNAKKASEKFSPKRQ